MSKEMSKEQGIAFEKVVKSALDALGIFQKTGRREQFVAVLDQIKAYKKEFKSELKIEFGDIKLS